MKKARKWRLVVHLVPPCSTFSKARDRSVKTRVRSMDHPAGFHRFGKRNKKAMDANIMARISIHLARCIHDDIGAHLSLENLDKSYIWLYGAPWFGSTKQFRDVRMNYCRCGKKYQKNMRFRVWGKSLGYIRKSCILNHGIFTCGAVKHKHVGMGRQ